MQIEGERLTERLIGALEKMDRAASLQKLLTSRPCSLVGAISLMSL